jgi:CubicO group peptidase (beta-lactamase class C family)
MQDGKVLYERGFGKMSVDSVIPIASGSKWLASALLMTFVDEGSLSLNDPIGKYLRYLYGTKATITIKQLFSHTSGFAGEIATMRDMKLTMKDAAYRISTERFAYPPGTSFAYGGASMQLGGRIIEIVGKKSFEELFQQRIAKPLGMVRTSFYGLGKTQNPLLGGGAQSSAREYSHFLQMLVNKGVWNGRRILSEFSVADMHLNHAGGLPVLRRLQSTSANLTLTSEYANYGLGVWRTSPTPVPSDDIIEVSSQGRFGFSPWIDVRRNVIGVLATYTPQHKMQATFKQMKKLLREIIPPVHLPPVQTASVPHSSGERKR